MEKKRFTYRASHVHKGRRLDVFLTDSVPGKYSRSHIQRLISHGTVTVNGTARNSHYRLRTGDFIEIAYRVPPPQKTVAEKIPLDILYEDEHILVVNKSAGMVTHPGSGNYTGTLVNALLHHTGKLSQEHSDRPGIVHRLDKDTSGVLLIARNERAHRICARQFGTRKVRKIYIAAVEGVFQLDNDIVALPIGRHPHTRKKQAVRHEGGKEAVTAFHILRRFRTASLVRVQPKTGRTHQIRVHCASMGHPVIGDYVYGARIKQIPISRHALHAAELRIRHPDNGRDMTFTAPLPDDMVALLRFLEDRGR